MINTAAGHLVARQTANMSERSALPWRRGSVISVSARGQRCEEMVDKVWILKARLMVSAASALPSDTAGLHVGCSMPSLSTLGSMA